MDKIIIKRAEDLVKQQLFGGFMLVMAVVMVANSLGYIDFVQAGNVNNTNMSINITSGVLSVDNAPTQMDFATQTYPSTNNVECNEEFDNIAVTDYRDTNTAWALTINATSLTGSTYNILANKLSIKNDDAVVLGTTNANVVIGPNSTLNNGGALMMNGTTQAAGINTYWNGKLFLDLAGTPNVDDYTGTIYYTLV